MNPPLSPFGVIVRVVLMPLILLAFALWALGEITFGGD